MKKIFTIITLSVLIFSVTPKPANALVISFDVPVLITDIVNGLSTAGSYIQDTLNQANTAVTAFNTEKAAWKSLVTDPFYSKVTLETLKRINQQTVSLVSGNMGGQPLAIANPKQYITNTGHLSVYENMDTVFSANGAYSGSILNAIIPSTRSESDVNGNLTSLSQSSIPLTIQKNLCKDDNKLSSLALNDVKQNGGDSNNAVSVSVRKKEIYDSYCKGDPTKDKALEKRLVALNQQKPEVGSWDTWLLATGGDNTYTRTNLTQILIDQQKKDAEAKAEAERQMGKGLISQTKCGPNDTDYRTYGGQKYCPKDKIIITTGSAQVADSYQNTINSQNNILLNAYGGQAETPSVGNINSLFGSFKVVNNAFTNTSNYSGSTGTSSTPNTSVSSNTVYTHTLKDGSKEKNDLVKPIKNQLTEHYKSLDSLKDSDSKYISDANSYMSDLSSGKSCYDGLVSSFPVEYFPIKDENGFFVKWSDQVKYEAIRTLHGSEFDSAYNFYRSGTEETTILLTKTNNELASIDTTKTLIDRTIKEIEASDSSERIQELFSNYQNTIDTQNLPTTLSARQKASDVLTYEEKIRQLKENKVADGNVVYAGQYAIYSNTCSKLRTDEFRRRHPMPLGGD